MSLNRYVLFRSVQIIPTIFLIIVFNFLLINITPGDPVEIMAGEFATQEYVDAVRVKYGLNQPLLVRLGTYLKTVVVGDLGFSYDYNQPVLELIIQRLPATLLLVLTSQFLGVLLGISLGIVSARNHPNLFDSAMSLLTSILYSLPVFWVGLMGILVFGVQLGWLPTSGMTSISGAETGWAHYVDVLRHLLMPALSLTIVWILPIFYRISRGSVLETLHEDFIVTARAKGLPPRIIFYRHALRNALLPSLTMIGLNLGLAVSGALLTETVFGWPGMGTLMYQAIFARDYPLIMGVFIFTAVSVVVATLVTDILYRVFDPRVELN